MTLMISSRSPFATTSGNGQTQFSVREVCRASIASIKVFGYRGRFSATMSTAGMVRTFLTGSACTPAVAAQMERLRVEVRDVTEREVDEALALAAQLDGDGFEASVRRAARGEWIAERYVGLLASAPEIVRARRLRGAASAA